MLNLDLSCCGAYTEINVKYPYTLATCHAALRNAFTHPYYGLLKAFQTHAFGLYRPRPDSRRKEPLGNLYLCITGNACKGPKSRLSS